MPSPDCPGLLHRGAAKITPWGTASELPNDKQIHQLRLAIKSLRAGLALMRPWLQQQPLKQALQQLSRYLAPSRDQYVALGWLDFFIAGQASEGRLHSLLRLRECLDQPLQQFPLNIRELQALAQAVMHSLKTLPHYHPKLGNWQQQLQASAAQLCAQAPQLYNRYEQTQDCTALHRWRKLGKRVYYQQKLLQACGLEPVLAQAKLKKLGKLLGEVQDLCQLSHLLDLHAEQLRSQVSKQDFFASQQFLLWQREARLAEAAAVQEGLAI